MKITLHVEGELCDPEIRLLHLIQKGIQKMTAQADQINASLDALKVQNDLLVQTANDIKAALDAAVAGGTGMTAAEVQAILDKVTAMTTSDSGAVAADALPKP